MFIEVNDRTPFEFDPDAILFYKSTVNGSVHRYIQQQTKEKTALQSDLARAKEKLLSRRLLPPKDK